jgi:hypothetical protein
LHQLALLVDLPDGRSAQGDRLSVGFATEHAVVPVVYPPAGRDPASVVVLERLDDLQLQVVHLLEEGTNPCLELLSPLDACTRARADEILDDELVDGVRAVGVPHPVPERLDQFHRVDG